MALVSKTTEFFSGFDPRMIPGCILWLDGTDSQTITGTTQVTEWRDKSASGSNFTRKSTGYPAVSNIQFSSLNGLYFGSNAALVNSNLAIPSSYTFFAVATRETSNGSYGYIAKVNTAADFYGFFGVEPRNSFATFVGTNTAWRDVASNTPKRLLTNIPAVMAYTVDGAVLTPFWNGQAMTTKTGSATATNGLTIGDASTATFGQPWLGTIGEVLLYSNALPSYQRQQIEGYLMWKWKLRRNEPISSWASGTNPLTFNPTSVSGISVWLDASDTSTLTLSGSNVTGWADKSGLGRTVTFRGGGSFVYDRLARAVVTSNNSFTVNSDARKSTTQFLNVFIVYRWLGGDSNGMSSNVCLWGADQGGGFNRFQLLGFPGGPDIAYTISRSGNTSPNVIPVQGLDTTNQVLYSCRYASNVSTGGGMFVRVNGFQTSLSGYTEGGVSTQTTMTSTAFGAIDELNAYSNRFAFNEILIYRADITDTDRINIESYLAYKWNIPWFTQVDSRHPFSNDPIFHRPLLPTDNTGLTAWLDAGDYSTITLATGTSVSNWRDKSGFQNNASQFVSNIYYPTYSNGSIVFDGTDFLQIVNPSIRPTNAYAIVKSDVSSGHVYRKGRNGATDLETVLRFSNAALQTFYVNTAGTVSNVTVSNLFTTDRILLESTWDGTTIRLYTNGTERGTQALSGTQRTATVECTDMRIGAQFDAASNTSAPGVEAWIGSMNELVFFSNALSIQERQQVEGYLAWKWGTQASLPAGHPYTSFYPLTAQFTPGQATGLALWLDAADLTTFEMSGTNIRRWRDKSGGGMYSFSASQYDASAIGVCTISNDQFGKNLHAVRFTGANNFVGNTSITGTGLTAFAVLSSDSNAPSTNARVVSIATPGQADFDAVGRATVIYLEAVQSNRVATYRNNTLIGRAATPTSNTPFLAEALYTGSTGAIYVDGSLGTLVGPTASTGSFASTLYGIGNYAGAGTERLVGYIGEVLMFSNALTTSERYKVEGYLAWKWNLQSRLPLWHPYKYLNP